MINLEAKIRVSLSLSEEEIVVEMELRLNRRLPDRNLSNLERVRSVFSP